MLYFFYIYHYQIFVPCFYISMKNNSFFSDVYLFHILLFIRGKYYTCVFIYLLKIYNSCFFLCIRDKYLSYFFFIIFMSDEYLSCILFKVMVKNICLILFLFLSLVFLFRYQLHYFPSFFLKTLLLNIYLYISLTNIYPIFFMHQLRIFVFDYMYLSVISICPVFFLFIRDKCVMCFLIFINEKYLSHFFLIFIGNNYLSHE